MAKTMMFFLKNLWKFIFWGNTFPSSSSSSSFFWKVDANALAMLTLLQIS